MKKNITKLLNREVVSYIICGALTTFVNLIIYKLCYSTFSLNLMLANIIAWVGAVLFAYIVNKVFVFQSKTKEQSEIIKELVGFFGGRIGTLVVESAILYIFVTMLNFDEMIIKLIAQFIVLILNFIISKLFVFKKKN